MGEGPLQTMVHDTVSLSFKLPSGGTCPAGYDSAYMNGSSGTPNFASLYTASGGGMYSNVGPPFLIPTAWIPSPDITKQAGGYNGKGFFSSCVSNNVPLINTEGNYYPAGYPVPKGTPN